MDRRQFIAGAAALALASPAIAKHAEPGTAEQLYEYLLRMCLCSDGDAAACHVVVDTPEQYDGTGQMWEVSKFRMLRYHTRMSHGVKEEGADLPEDGLCTTEAEAVKRWLANLRKDIGDATHIIWRERPKYEFVSERWVPNMRIGTFERDQSFVPGGTIYSRLWFGKL